MQPERAYEYEEVAVVRLANAVVQPLAMVVKTANTTVALATVLACPMRIPLAEFAVEVVFPKRVCTYKLAVSGCCWLLAKAFLSCMSSGSVGFEHEVSRPNKIAKKAGIEYITGAAMRVEPVYVGS